jgi:hypothetical protein
VTFVVDATPPAVTVTQPAPGSASTTVAPTFAGTLGTEQKDTPSVSVSLYAGSQTTGTPIATFAGSASRGVWTANPNIPLADGAYTQASQTDNGGGIGTSTETFNVDTVKPTASVTAPGDGSSYHVGDHLPTAYSCADGGSGIASCTAPVAQGSPVDTAAVGQHTFTVAATDRAGNTSATTVHYTVLAPPPPAPTPRANPRLRLLSSRLRTPPQACSRHPRHLSARACSPAVIVSGVIDPRAAGQTLALTWTDGRGHRAMLTIHVPREGRWSATLRLPAAALAHAGHVTAAYRGSSTLAPATISRAVVRKH